MLCEKQRNSRDCQSLCRLRAQAAPAIFALTLKPSENDQNDNATHLQNRRFVLELVSRLYGEKRVPEAAVTLWALLHGMTVLQQAGGLGKDKPTTSFAVGLQMWIDRTPPRSPSYFAAKKREAVKTIDQTFG